MLNFILICTALCICSYLLGAIPFGFLIGKARGVDVREVGSKNTGATNVFRTVGKGAGIATFVLDMGKGWFGTCYLSYFLLELLRLFNKELVLFFHIQLFQFCTPVPTTDTAAVFVNYNCHYLYIVTGVCAVVGHNWTCFLGFKGGKGVATSLGVLLALVPVGALLALVVWVIVLLISRYVSLASIIAAAALGVGVWWLYGDQPVWFLCVISALALLAILKHHANIRRLLNGSENRMSFSRKKTP